MIRGIKSLSRRIDREFFPLFWHLGSFSGPSRVWRIHNYYDIPSRAKDEYVRGQGDPGNILAYLQFRADIAEDCSLLNAGAASLLCRFYGFAKTPYSEQEKGP